MIDKKKLEEAMSTMMYSGGGDTPPEAIWAFNEFMEAFGMKSSIDDEENTEPGYEDFEKELINHVF